EAATDRAWSAARKASLQAAWCVGEKAGLEAGIAERHGQCTLLRCIFGNPLRAPPPIDPSWLRWNDGTVRRIAQGIYDERAFDRMGILADALLDAGCDNDDMLTHCREQDGVHSKGCWVLDLLLNKE